MAPHSALFRELKLQDPVTSLISYLLFSFLKHRFPLLQTAVYNRQGSRLTLAHAGSQWSSLQ